MTEQHSSNDQPIKAICHCGAITVTAPRVPQYVNECKCSICRRYGVVWGYYRPSEVTIELKEGTVPKQYIWGDRENSFNFCGTCGCVCYWWPISKDPSGPHAKMGVNTRNVDPDLLRLVEHRITYKWITAPVKDPSTAHADDKAKYRSDS